MKDYELRVDELILLEDASRTVDLIALLHAGMDGQPLMVAGSMGQQREHPLLSEIRHQRAFLARLLHQMKLPDVVEEAPKSSSNAWHGYSTKSEQARHAANARWRDR